MRHTPERHTDAADRTVKDIRRCRAIDVKYYRKPSWHWIAPHALKGPGSTLTLQRESFKNSKLF